MARHFSQREKNVFVAGAVFLICFLVGWFLVRPQWDELGRLKTEVQRMSSEYDQIRKIERQYNVLKRETDPVMHRILQRRKDFDLLSFVAETENKLNFGRMRHIPAPATAHGDFEKRSSSFLYRDKKLHEIVDFLKEIAKPENVVNIETLRITPKTSDRSQLEMDVKLSTVVPTK